MKEITIIGGGVAGLSLGIALRKTGVSVGIHEKRDYPAHRVCGEFISGVSEQVLVDLGIRHLFADAQPIDQFRWYIKDELLIESELDNTSYGVSRYHLDHQLALLFQHLGGRLYTNSAYKGNLSEGYIDATGKGSSKESEWLGLSLHLEARFSEKLEMYSGVDGYIGLSPIENGKTNVTGLFKKQTHLKGKGLELVMAYLRHGKVDALAEEISNYQVTEQSFCAISGFQFGTQSSKGVLRLGDRSRLIPPFVGNGMSMALESAVMAAPWIQAYACQHISWQECLSEISNLTKNAFSNRMRVAQALHPMMLSSLGLKTMTSLSKLQLLPVKKIYQLTR